MTTDIRAFISYKSEYRDIAIRVRDVLHEWGYTTWFDQDDILKGEYFRHAIQYGLESSQVVIGILTEEALKSREVLTEWDYAFSGQSRLLLLRYQKVDLPYWLRSVQYIDCTVDETTGLHQLRDVLQTPKSEYEYQTPPETITRHQSVGTIGNYNPTVAASDNRTKMLHNVYHTWVQGVLYANLPSGATDLGLDLQPDAVIKSTDYSDYTLPNSSRDIETIFHDMGGQLLILGEPGSGKTILLLQLTQKLLAHAQQDTAQPIPTVFNLSSWGKNQPSFDDWLVDQLKLGYGVPRKIAHDWIENGKLTLLLDGLDEIAPGSGFTPGSDESASSLEHRAITLRSACIEAINHYRDSHPMIDMVVCSRNRDYEALTQKLNLNSAILLHALTDAQIDHYLTDSTDTAGIRELLNHEPQAREMARSPFLLTLMKEAYSGIPYIKTPFNQLKLDDPAEAKRRDHLLEKYTDQHIRASTDNEYSEKHIRHWLHWLALQMVERKVSVFYIENLQLDWTQKRLAYNATFLFIFSLIFVIDIGLSISLIASLGGVLIAGVLVILLAAALWGLHSVQTQIEFVENITWSTIRVKTGVMLLILGLMIGLMFSVVVDLLLGLLVGLAFSVIFGLIGGLHRPVDFDPHNIPNEGFNLSLKNSVQFGLVFGFLIGLIFLIVIGFSSSHNNAIPIALGTFLLISVQFAMIFGGGLPIIQHIALRFALSLEDVIPRWRYDTFLDHCVALGLLRKVGGGYIFRHRLLLEYFAEQYGKQRNEGTT